MMKPLIVYCHPSADSFTAQLKDHLLSCFEQQGIAYKISDLYAMDFRAELSATEYQRECFYRTDIPVSDDVLLEQEKVSWADTILFVFPLFWNDMPAKLKGWFDRVWTYGFAYGSMSVDGCLAKATMPQMKKVLFLCSCGNSIENLESSGKLQAMQTTWLVDRIFDRTAESKIVLFDLMSHENPDYERQREKNLLKLDQVLKTWLL